jgi:hypothetical protein
MCESEEMMMDKTCNNCLHRELCNVHGYIDADECACFKNKADFVEVVRCKDCNNKVDYCGRIMCGRLMYQFKEGVGGLVATIPEHFCSYGERRDT